VAYEARLARMEPVVSYPVKITYKWYLKNKRKDIDNVAFAKKFINDGLVDARVLEDDSQRFVVSFEDNFFIDAKNPRVEIEIQSAYPHNTIAQ
jgi:Holliday junction resolvase RusA-like endonuclease